MAELLRVLASEKGSQIRRSRDASTRDYYSDEDEKDDSSHPDDEDFSPQASPYRPIPSDNSNAKRFETRKCNTNTPPEPRATNSGICSYFLQFPDSKH